MGNVHGRIEGQDAGDGDVIMIGSHYDTVVDAGKYDGALGIVAAISAVKEILANHNFKDKPGGPFQLPVEVVAFSDEDGARFQVTQHPGSRQVESS